MSESFKFPGFELAWLGLRAMNPDGFGAPSPVKPDRGEGSSLDGLVLPRPCCSCLAVGLLGLSVEFLFSFDVTPLEAADEGLAVHWGL